MQSNEIRQKFIEYFKENQHTWVPGSSLIPPNDPTLLFTNAGMVQFKEVFLGSEQRHYTQAVTVQPCLRAGGKHNDLDNVGYTARHHTFFEMLGNFSFGGYFKREAIQYGWDFLTKILGLPAERLWITVFKDDQESADIWLKEVGINAKRFSYCGEADNFWSMGETGPCGPCTEIFYDHGDNVEGGTPGSPDQEGDRYVEIWNLVFMQYNRDSDGRLSNLSRPSVDTGMGLERISAVMQGVVSNYDTDIFKPLMGAIATVLGIKNEGQIGLKVIADHLRAAVFLMADDVLPSNEGRGYVLRRIVRRALRFGYQFGTEEPFLFRSVDALVKQMAEAYPQLRKKQAHIEASLQQEEGQFAGTVKHGIQLLKKAIATLDGDTLSGKIAFQLYDTYGFPLDLTRDLLVEQGLDVDEVGFEACMQSQRARSKQAQAFSVDYSAQVFNLPATEFVGYSQSQTTSLVLAVMQGGQQIEQLTAGQEADIVLDVTPFYAESGGQVGDTGQISGDGRKFSIVDTQKYGEVIVHRGRLISGTLSVGDTVQMAIDERRRTEIRRHHSATHLLHAALREVLGNQVVQKGSLVTSDRLRFDFSYPKQLSADQLEAVEAAVNQAVRQNDEVETDIISPDEAKARGAMSLFGEKYGEQVRVLTMGAFSCELCGGTHVDRTGDIGLIKVLSESSIATGIRRLEAVVGESALLWMQQKQADWQATANLLNVGSAKIADKVAMLQEQLKEKDKQIERLIQLEAKQKAEGLLTQSQKLGELNVIVQTVEGMNAKGLRAMAELLKARMANGVIVLACYLDGKLNLVSASSSKGVHAGELLSELAEKVGGKAGGRPDMAQGGGSDASQLNDAMLQVFERLQQRSQ